MAAGVAPQGVDLNLDTCGLSHAKLHESDAKSLDSYAVIGRAFWPSVNLVFNDEDRKLLNDIFNPHLSDRRDEGDRFIPPQTTSGYVEQLRCLVKEEAAVREQRKSHFYSDRFVIGNPGPLFLLSWRF